MTQESRRMTFVLITLAMVIGFNVVGAVTAAGWRLASGSTALTLAVMIGWKLRFRDPVVGRWLMIGFIAGWLEIATDAWLVASTGTLVYPSGEPKVWDSPLYMPFAWMIVLTQMGVMATWLAQRLTLARASLVTGLLGGLSIPLYEMMAHYAGYWSYIKTPMLLHAPVYIVISEFLLSLPLAWVALKAKGSAWAGVIVLGVLVGLLMIPSVMVAWWLVGPCEGAVFQFHCKG